MAVQDAYSDITDLLLGDIPLAQRHGDGTAAVKSAAEDIDSQIGHIYETPVLVDADPKNRPTRLLLKKVNNLIASGRIILDQAAGGEDAELHAYGASLLREGLELLRQIASGAINLTGVNRLDETTAPQRIIVLQEDPESLVEGFYKRTQPAFGYGYFDQPMLPYGGSLS